MAYHIANRTMGLGRKAPLQAVVHPAYFCVFASLLCFSEGIREIQMRREGSCGWKRKKKSCRRREKRHFNTCMFCLKDHVFIWCSQKQLYSTSIYQCILSIKDCAWSLLKGERHYVLTESSKYDFVCTTAAHEEVMQSSAHITCLNDKNLCVA